MKKYTIKQISEIAKEIANDLDDCCDNYFTNEQDMFLNDINLLIRTLKDIEDV